MTSARPTRTGDNGCLPNARLSSQRCSTGTRQRTSAVSVLETNMDDSVSIRRRRVHRLELQRANRTASGSRFQAFDVLRAFHGAVYAPERASVGKRHASTCGRVGGSSREGQRWAWNVHRSARWRSSQKNTDAASFLTFLRGGLLSDPERAFVLGPQVSTEAPESARNAPFLLKLPRAGLWRPACQTTA
jgi:hypothetical protein